MAGYAALISRALQIQAQDAGWLAERAALQREGTLRLAPQRGAIRDRTGVLLAVSAEVESVAASPRHLQDARRISGHLARALNLPESQVAERLNSSRSFVWLKRWVAPDQAQAVRQLGLEGVSLHPERKRFYPSRESAAAYLGFAGRDGEGLSGVELAFDSSLRGSEEALPAFRDVTGKLLLREPVRSGKRSGATLVLALDSKLQHFAEGSLGRARQRTGAKHASLVALDPRNGDILALAESPGFNPNRFWTEDPASFRTRAFVDSFEPGSTLKPFVVAIGLETGSVSPEDRFDCEQGAWRVRGRTIRDYRPHGVLSVADILRVSSNIGAAKLSNRVGASRLIAGLRKLGFGARTGSGFPGEAAGKLRSLRPAQRVELANLAFGQGVTVTAVQLATAGALLANGGFRVRPRLALRLETREEVVEFPDGLGERVLSERTARSVMSMLQAAVARGTGRAAALPRHAVAGKTGTAQKVVNGRYSEERYVASFLGIVPVQSPRLVVVVVLDEPQSAHTGGRVAAPVFREIAAFIVDQLALPGEDSV